MAEATVGARAAGALPLVALFLVPLAASLLWLLPLCANTAAWQAFFAHPQLAGALRLTLWTGTASTLLALVCAIIIVMEQGAAGLARRAGVFMAVPHLAFAVGLAFLLVPTGVLARLIAIGAGWLEPPQWVTVQDPWGMSLIAALALKETPFLVWAMASTLSRGDSHVRLARQLAVAQSLGHGPRRAWCAVVLPEVLHQARWPLLAVLSYGLTVVDVALVIGPTQPPTLATLVWTDLSDADPATTLRGHAGVLALSLTVAMVMAVMSLFAVLVRALWRRWVAAGPPARQGAGYGLRTRLWAVFAGVYAVVVVVLLVQSVAIHWPFPHLVPDAVALSAWRALATAPRPILTTLAVALAATATAMAMALCWLETQPARRDAAVLAACTVVLCLPALLLALGQYHVALAINIAGRWPGLLFAHLLPVFAYVFVLLAGPYRAYDARWRQVAHGLGQRDLAFLWRIKWPMLRPVLWSAAAVGFAVSVGQFVPAQLLAAGRFSTLPMEAVTLASGGNRPLFAAYAALLALLPLAMFAMAAALSRPRWRVG